MSAKANAVQARTLPEELLPLAIDCGLALPVGSRGSCRAQSFDDVCNSVLNYALISFRPRFVTKCVYWGKGLDFTLQPEVTPGPAVASGFARAVEHAPFWFR